MPLFAGITLYFVYKIGRKIGSWTLGMLAMGILSTFDLFLARSRAVNTDGMLLAALTGTTLAALSSNSPLLIALGISLGIWIKGIAGVLIAIIIAPQLLARGKNILLKTAGFTAIFTLPWHLYQYFTNGSAFYKPYLLEQVITRTISPIEFHLESRWYYFQFLVENIKGGALYLLIFSIIFMIANAIKNRKINKYHLFIWWISLPLIIFTLAKTRLYWYILPIYPAIALSIAWLFDSIASKGKLRPMLYILVVGLSLQALVTVSKSVEINKKIALVPLDVQLAKVIKSYPDSNLLVLVPDHERIAEAILPQSQRISSSFRYGGAPNLVFYSQKHIDYYYNIDDWLSALNSQSALTMLAVSDINKLPTGYVIESINQEYALAIKGEDALR
jgi:4-amino-4-deoxy-L-arabinose transferase-like glycosyltransferase